MVRSSDHGVTWVPVGIDAQPLAVGPPGTIYAADSQFRSGLHTTSLYKTTDGGLHWSTLLERSSPGPLFRSNIVIDPSNPMTLYRIDLTRLGTLVDASSLSRSPDGGLTWVGLGGGWPYFRINAFAVDPQNAGTLYVALIFVGGPPYGPPTPPPTVYKSTDAGDTWAALVEDFVSGIGIDPLVPTRVYLAGGAGLYRSFDGGATFALPSTSLPPSTTNLTVDPVHPTRLYATASGYGVLASGDSGVTWTPINSGLDSLFVNSLVVDAVGDFLHVSAGGLFDYQVVDTPAVLSLNPGRRFRITLSATNPRTGETAAGLAMPMSSIFGFFSLPGLTGDASNPEVFVKILDGTGVNGHYWVFYGGLTSLPYDLTVTDDATGRTRTYTKPAGSACGGFDTEGFPPE